MNTKKIIILLALFLIVCQLSAQKYFTKTGNISFSSSTPLEDIEATSHTATTVFDLESGKIQWAVLIKSFEFEKALMQEHFNENYMESNTYPKAKFTGTIVNPELLDFSKDQNIEVKLKGDLTIHGKTNNIHTKAKFTIADCQVSGDCQMKLLVADYGIEIPSVVRNNIAKEIKIKIHAQYEVLN